jgi:hypothetical protein
VSQFDAYPTVVKLAAVSHIANTPADIAASLRELADKIESGEIGAAESTVTIIEHADGDLSRWLSGKLQDTVRLSGLLFMAAHRTVDGWNP